MNSYSTFLIASLLTLSTHLFAQNDSLTLKNLTWDKNAPAGSTELFIPSAQVMLAGVMYRPNGVQKHPTLILLHGFPGNERNLDIAQVMRAHGWNVIYFDYRGSWGSQGKFSFTHCVEDVVNTVAFCHKYQDSLHIDTSNIVLFGHSMGGWVCLKALQQLPSVKKGFALSTWNIGADENVPALATDPKLVNRYFVLNASNKEMFSPVLQDRHYFDLVNDAAALSGKQVVLLDEHVQNKPLADRLKAANKIYFDYQVWDTDHPFTNKRVALMNKVLSFLER